MSDSFRVQTDAGSFPKQRQPRSQGQGEGPGNEVETAADNQACHTQIGLL